MLDYTTEQIVEVFDDFGGKEVKNCAELIFCEPAKISDCEETIFPGPTGMLIRESLLFTSPEFPTRVFGLRYWGTAKGRLGLASKLLDAKILAVRIIRDVEGRPGEEMLRIVTNDRKVLTFYGHKMEGRERAFSVLMRTLEENKNV